MAEPDLNLLRVFDALIELGSVTRAASRLGVTQSAVSHALGRLRAAFDDPLFVRAPSGLQPTVRAREMAPAIREGLGMLRAALSPSLFDPATAHRRFTISAGSYFCELLMPDLLARAREVAPHVSFAVSAPGADLVALLDDGAVDLALGAFGRVPRRLNLEPLFDEQLVWIASADSVFAHDPPTRPDIAARAQLRIATGRPQGARSYVSEAGLERRVTASSSLGAHDGRGSDAASTTIYDLQTAFAIVGRTELVALVPRRSAERRAGPDRLILIEAGDEAETIEMAMLWHGKQAADAGLAWLRTLIHACLNGD